MLRVSIKPGATFLLIVRIYLSWLKIEGVIWILLKFSTWSCYAIFKILKSSAWRSWVDKQYWDMLAEKNECKSNSLHPNQESERKYYVVKPLVSHLMHAQNLFMSFPIFRPILNCKFVFFPFQLSGWKN